MVRAALATECDVMHTGLHMIYVQYENGMRLQGVLLALGGQFIRVAIQGSDDAVEYRLVSGRWVAEDCEVVSFEFSEDFPTEDPREIPAMLPSDIDTPVLHRIM